MEKMCGRCKTVLDLRWKFCVSCGQPAHKATGNGSEPLLIKLNSRPKITEKEKIPGNQIEVFEQVKNCFLPEIVPVPKQIKVNLNDKSLCAEVDRLAGENATAIERTVNPAASRNIPEPRSYLAQTSDTSRRAFARDDTVIEHRAANYANRKGQFNSKNEPSRKDIAVVDSKLRKKTIRVQASKREMNYLDHVGTVGSLYQDFRKREKQFEGLNAISSEKVAFHSDKLMSPMEALKKLPKKKKSPVRAVAAGSKPTSASGVSKPNSAKASPVTLLDGCTNYDSNNHSLASNDINSSWYWGSSKHEASHIISAPEFTMGTTEKGYDDNPYEQKADTEVEAAPSAEDEDEGVPLAEGGTSMLFSQEQIELFCPKEEEEVEEPQPEPVYDWSSSSNVDTNASESLNLESKRHAGNAVVGRCFKNSCRLLKTITKECLDETELFITDPLSCRDIIETLSRCLNVMDEVLLRSEMAHLEAQETCNEYLKLYESQRAASAFRVSAAVEDITKAQALFARRYKVAKDSYDQSLLDNTAGSFISFTKKHINSSPAMDNIQKEADSVLDNLGNHLRSLQTQEVQFLRDLTEAEYLLNESMLHWQPKHFALIKSARLCWKRMQFMKTQSSIVIIQKFVRTYICKSM